MKKILLSFSLLVAVFATKAQTVFNEFYTDPGSGKHEFFELYNTAPAAENLNCYTLITWFKDGNTTGFYVLDFPDSTVASKQFFVVASADPFNVQAKTNVNAAFSWNLLNFVGSTGSLKVYTRSGNSYVVTNPPANFNDLFHTNTGTPAAYAMFLFKGNQLVNGFMGGMNSTTVPSDITSMPTLDAAVIGTCGLINDSIHINWASVTLAENTTANGGSDNGFIRDRDGKCGSWKKSSSQVQHTPGVTNGSATGLVGGFITEQATGPCGQTAGDSTTVTADVVSLTGDATETNSFEVEIQLYYDNAPFGGAIGGEDIYKISKFQSTLAQGPVVFKVFPQNQRTIIVYKSVLGCFEFITPVTNTCSPLPVKFKSFTATRTNSTNVAVKWETLSEENAAGFAVERNTKGGWEEVAYIPSQAAGGNSSSTLTYQLNDLNPAKGVSQYRIRQEDLDGAAKMSDIRSVRGEGQKGSTIVYPNPSSDGKVNVVFAGGEITKRNVSVQDMSGRTVKQWSNYSNNNIQIENLTPGFYTIRIVDIGTGEQSVEKIVVNKR